VSKYTYIVQQNPSIFQTYSSGTFLCALCTNSTIFFLFTSRYSSTFYCTCFVSCRVLLSLTSIIID